MKGEGYYVARGLSFKEAEFQELECKLTAEQRDVYDASAQVCVFRCFTYMLYLFYTIQSTGVDVPLSPAL